MTNGGVGFMLQNGKLEKGSETNGFEILENIPLEEMNARGIYARHIRTGCEVFHILNEDSENLFAFAFPTQPDDSKGCAHIIEHSVLCGSEKFPLKDPFVVLCNQSVKTFLNAMTYPDKTVYPASSVMEADYFNLMSVYGDAVFFPLLEEWAFLQEGRRFEIQEDGSVSIQGVVFNEMKGNYSSFESVADDWTVRALFENTVYEHDAGGDPECIPDLTFEEFRAFHKKYYHPSNCRIFLYGNIATERQLEFLDSRFLSGFSRATPPSLPPLPARWTAPKVLRKPAPPGDEDSRAAGDSVSVNWLLPETADARIFLCACLIEEILMGHDGSPLSRALLDSGLGEDILSSNGLETDMRLLAFSAGLRGVKPKNAGKVEAVILETLAGIVKNGVPRRELESAVRSMDFLNREIRRASGPFSLVLMSRSLRGWLRGKMPWETMRYIPVFESLKAEIAENPRLLTDLIQSWFLDNPHRCLLSVYPDKDWQTRSEAVLQEKIERFVRALDEREEGAWKEARAKQDALFGRQRAPDSAENLARIPHLSPSELPLPDEAVPSSFLRFGNNALAMTHEQPVNGITYANFFFPVDILSPEDYPYLPFFAAVYSNVGLSAGESGGALSWADAASEAARLFGGIGFSLYVSSAVAGAELPAPFAPGDAGRDFLVLRIKMLEELSEEAFRFALRVFRRADFSDTKRLRTLFSEYKNDFEASLVPSGHQYVASRVSVFASRARAVDELWSGLSQLRFLRRFSKKADFRRLADKLTELQEKIRDAGVFVHLTGTESGLKTLSGCVASLMRDFSGFAPRNPASREASAFFPLVSAGEGAEPPAPGLETVCSEMQVGFSATALPAPPYPQELNVACAVLGHWLTNGSLWEKIRTTGGAYGVFAHPDSLEGVFVFSTYRDPDPVRSLSVFASAVREAASLSLSEEELEKLITGCYSKEIRPKTPSAKAFTDCIRLLFGITPELRRQKLSFLKAMSPEKIRDAAAFLAARLTDARSAVLGTKKLIKLPENTDSSGKITDFVL